MGATEQPQRLYWSPILVLQTWEIEPCLMEFTDGTDHLIISNPMGFTQKLEKELQCKMLKKFFHPEEKSTLIQRKAL